MSKVIPWQIRNLISQKTPVLYYLVNSLIYKKNSDDDWDELLAASWDDVGRTWPNRVEGIKKVTNQDDKILDVGCGTGSILRMLRQGGYGNLFGLEHSALSVNRLSKMGITMRQGNLPKIAFDDNEFDVVIASEVMEHILFHKVFLKEVVRVLKPGGKALIYVPNDCMGPIDEPSHVRSYTQAALAALLSQFGDLKSVEVVSEDHFAASFLYGCLVKRL